MQYNHYPSSAHQVHPASHPSQSPDEYSPSYPDAPHHHTPVSYAAVNQATHLSAGSMGQNMTAQYPYSAYATQTSTNDHRSYYATTPPGTAIEHYSSSGSPTSSYASPNPSGQLNGHGSRHHAQLSHHQQQQFIPTPSQAYQVYSSPGSAPSSVRSRSTVEPYYHMSPNPQHAVHAPPASTTHSRSSASSGSSHSHHAHGHHTGTIPPAAGERYPCDLCERSFTRLHDRRRHYETVHATSPVLHKCRYCQKDFSRADSLKRHVDNGCDEMPR